MGDHGNSSKNKKKHKHKHKHSDDDTASSSPSTFGLSDAPKRLKRSSIGRRRHRDDGDDDDEDEDDVGRSSRREKERRSDRKCRRRETKHKRRSWQRVERKLRVSESDEESGSSGDDHSEPERCELSPEAVLGHLLKEFPGVAGDLQKVPLVMRFNVFVIFVSPIIVILKGDLLVFLILWWQTVNGKVNERVS